MALFVQRSAFLEAIQKHDPSSTAVVNHDNGTSFSYGTILHDIVCAKEQLMVSYTKDNIAGARVAFLVENSYTYVVTLLSVFACNAIAVPLAPSFPTAELRHIINNSGATVLLSSERYTDRAQVVISDGIEAEVLCFQSDSCHPSDLERSSDEVIEVKLAELSETNVSGMMLFTSGTTARPKSVMLSEAVLTAQAQSLLTAWQYSPSDHLLHVLPLHHIHGTVNALLVPLLAGSSIEFMYPFDVHAVWKRLPSPFLQTDRHDSPTQDAAKVSFNISIHDALTPISIFTAMPTV